MKWPRWGGFSRCPLDGGVLRRGNQRESAHCFARSFPNDRVVAALDMFPERFCSGTGMTVQHGYARRATESRCRKIFCRFACREGFDSDRVCRDFRVSSQACVTAPEAQPCRGKMELSGIPCAGGHNGTERDHPLPAAKNPAFPTRFSTSFCPSPILPAARPGRSARMSAADAARPGITSSRGRRISPPTAPLARGRRPTRQMMSDVLQPGWTSNIRGWPHPNRVTTRPTPPPPPPAVPSPRS